MFKRKLLQLATSAVLAAMGATAQGSILQASGSAMVNPDSGVVVGYWHNWCDGSGYQGGNAPCVKLDQIDPMYNVVNVSFMKVYDTAAGRIPTFHLDPAIGLSEQQFINQIAELNNQGRSVLIALGGADAHVELKTGDEQPFADEIIRLTDIYGFDGLDIDLEQAAVTAADNQTVIPAALRIVKDHYKALGKNFLITMAPEFPYLTDGGKYVPYIENLEGYYDWINPQFYNQGGDGIWIDGVGWIAQNSDDLKEEFIYYISDSLVNGTRGFHQIQHSRLVFGIPTSNDAAATGFVKDPQDLYNAFERLDAQGQGLRGVMTWSVNWDMGTDASGKAYNEQFIKYYGPFIHSNSPTPPPVEGKPVFKGIQNSRILHGSDFDAMAGVTAIDNEDGDLTGAIQLDGYVDTHEIGTYALTYRVTDSDGNTTSVVRSVEVYSLKPVFSGVDNTIIQLNTPFDEMAGVTATDAEDGDLTSSIRVSGSVNTSVVGVYSVNYSVTDSAGQTISVERKVTVSDGASCANPWDAGSIYLKGDEASHNGSLWQAGWWTQGEEPGSTGDWGVWRKVSDSSCGGGGQPDPEAEMTVSGVAAEYKAVDGQVNLSLQVTVNETMDLNAVITDSNGNVVSDASLTVTDNASLALTINNAEAGRYALTVTGTTTDGETASYEAGFTVKVDGGVKPPPGEYPLYDVNASYAAGDIVVGSDNALYECKPWPYTAWCSSPAYAPGSSQYWQDAWIRL